MLTNSRSSFLLAGSPMALSPGDILGPYEIVSANGVNEDERQLTWFDRSGKALGTVGPSGQIQWATISPDGNTVAFDRRDPQTNLSDVWLHDLTRGTDSRFTFTSPSPSSLLTGVGWPIGLMKPNRTRFTFSRFPSLAGSGRYRQMAERIRTGAGTAVSFSFSEPGR